MTKAPRKELSAMEELFVAAYLANRGNGTQAAIAAGYSEATAAQKASELLKRPHVAAAVQASRENIVRKFRVTAERVLEEMALISFSDIRHFAFDDNGYVALADGAPDHAMRAVKRIKRKLRLVPQKDGEPIREVESEIELWNKDGELRALGDYLAMFKENRRVDNDDDDDLTTDQIKERVVELVRVAAKRRAGAKPAAKAAEKKATR